MGLFGRKKKEAAAAPEDDDEEQEEQKPQEDATLSGKIEMIQADLTKINGTLESFKEVRKSTTERFSTINEQIGEMRGMITDVQRTVGMIEVKATKAADLVESVQPDKLMIQVQKEDGKIEGLRGMLEAKEEMLRNVMDQLKKMRDQMRLFRSVEQVIKLSEEVKDELMTTKRVVAEVERHADRVDNIFIEAQKSFENINTFADRLEDFKSDFKEVTAKLDKLDTVSQTFVKKQDFETKLEKIEKSDKRVKAFLEQSQDVLVKLDERFRKLEATLRGEFTFKIEKAEILSKSFEDLLKENPLFADGLKLQEYMNKHLGMDTGALKEVMHAQAAEVKEGKKEEAKPDAKQVEGMTPVKK